MITVNRTPTVGESRRSSSTKGLITLTRLVLLLGGMAAMLSNLQDLRAAPAPEDEEYRAAMQATIETVRKHKACPTDPVAFDKLVAQVFPMLYPRLANREREKDPEYLKRLLGLVSPEQMGAGQRVADFDSVNEGLTLRAIFGAVFAL